MLGFYERDEVGVFSVVVLDEHAFVLQADDGDSIPVIFSQRGDAQSESGAWS